MKTSLVLAIVALSLLFSTSAHALSEGTKTVKCFSDDEMKTFEETFFGEEKHARLPMGSNPNDHVEDISTIFSHDKFVIIEKLIQDIGGVKTPMNCIISFGKKFQKV